MQLSLEKSKFLHYTSTQLNTVFPDGNTVDLNKINRISDLTFDRINHCFKHVSFERYNKNGETILNHLYSDHYLMYLWFLSNTVWNETADAAIASKLYYLNKSLHGLDCMYDTKMPDIFLVIHGCGTMLGKANYSDYLVVLQGCTVGANKGIYPTFGKGVAITANSAVIGNSTIGNRATIGVRTTILDTDVEPDEIAYADMKTGELQTKTASECYAQKFFINDLKNLKNE